MLDGKTTTEGFVLDRCHDQVKAGDVVIAPFRGTPAQRFEVLADDGRGMFEVRRPNESISPMRPSTILAVAERIERGDAAEIAHAIETVQYIHANDCDFLTVETLRAYGVASDTVARVALVSVMGAQWFGRGRSDS